MPNHDPFKQANYIRQSLAHDKRPLGLFLGAGCPVSIKVSGKPLIPDIAGITKIVHEELAKSKECKDSFKRICEILHSDGYATPNIEEILGYIRSLKHVAGKETVRGVTGGDLEKLDQTLCSLIVTIVDKKLLSPQTAYHQVAAWIGSRSRTEPIEIFTTNYDLLMEQALEENRVPYFDGFIGSRHTFFDPHAMEEDELPARWARLWKLHGSINWCQDDQGVVSRNGNFEKNDYRRVIHPSHLKYDQSRRMPYLAMIDRLRAFIKQPSAVLVICGYSFRDEHLNEVLIQGLQGNPSAIAFSLMFGALENYKKAIDKAVTRTNLSLLAENAAVISGKKDEWISGELTSSAQKSIAVDWLDDKPSGKEGTKFKKSIFKLGDFEHLGSFLADLIGDEDGIANAQKEA